MTINYNFDYTNLSFYFYDEITMTTSSTYDILYHLVTHNNLVMLAAA